MEYTFKVFIKSTRYYPLKYFRETWQNTNRSVIFFADVVSLFEYRCNLSIFEAVRKNAFVDGIVDHSGEDIWNFRPSNFDQFRWNLVRPSSLFKI